MIVKDMGAYAKYTDVTGKLYIPLVYFNGAKRPCKHMCKRATEAVDYGKAVVSRYTRLKSGNQNTS